MKFSFQNKTLDNVEIVMRSLRYQLLNRNMATNEYNFVKPLDQNAYPRFHLYLTVQPDKTVNCSLHFDQKKPSYEGSTAHSGEYEGPLVTPEAKKITSRFSQ